MDESEKLRQQMGEIAGRYLKRTLDEMARLQELLEKVRNGTAPAIEEVERLAHKIHGSGAMFGFDAVSDAAQKIELLASSRAGDSEFMQRLETCISSLDEEVRAAARMRGIE